MDPERPVFFYFTWVKIQGRMSGLQSSVPLWQRYSLVLSNSLCQSFEFSFTEFQDRKPFFPKALFRFGTGTALSYPLPYAKAWNSALPNSRIESRFSPKLCVALATGQLCFIHCLMPKPVKAGFFYFTRVKIQGRMADFQSSVPLWHRDSRGFIFFQTQPPVKSQAHKAGVKKSSLLREPYILQFKIFKSLAGFFYRFPVSERTEPYKALSRRAESHTRCSNHMALA